MDSPIPNGFNEVDQQFCETIVQKLIEKTNFEKLISFYKLNLSGHNTE